MRELVRATDISHEASIRLALANAGIDAIASSSPYIATGRDRNGCLFLVGDADYERAAALVAGLQQSSLFHGPERQRVQYLRWALAGLIAALVIYGLWRGPS